MNPTLSLLLSSSFILVLSACGSDSSSSENDNDVVESEFVGLWDATNIIDDETDLIYLDLAADGTGTEYDYDGDSFDQGDNCYNITQNAFSLKRDGNSYIYTEAETVVIASVAIIDDYLFLTA